MTFSSPVGETLLVTLMMTMGAAAHEIARVDRVAPDHYESEKPIGRVVVADADYSVRRALHTTLFAAGFDVTEASGVDEVLAIVKAVRCDVALLGARMAGWQPVEICEELRACCPALRVLMLTAEDSEHDQLEALDAGADDCIAKPLRMSEVMARVRAAMRRTKAPHLPGQGMLRVGEIEVDPSRRLVYKGGNMIHVTPKEFELLVYLMIHAGTPIPHRQILTAVWGQENANRLEYLRTFMRQLRRKFEDQVDTPRYLLTNNHIGYRFAGHNEVPIK